MTLKVDLQLCPHMQYNKQDFSAKAFDVKVIKFFVYFADLQYKICNT